MVHSFCGPTLPTNKSLEHTVSGPLGPTSSLPCQRAKQWNTLLRAYWGPPRAYLANEQIIGTHCCGPTGPYIEPTLPTSKSLEHTVSGLLGPTSGLPCQPAYSLDKHLRQLLYQASKNPTGQSLAQGTKRLHNTQHKNYL